MPSPSPFTIAVPDDKLALLRKKLELTTWPDELEDAGTDYGAPLSFVKRLAKRWQDGYDWRAQEAAINAELPQFTTDVKVEGHGTINIHFVHKKSAAGAAIPLLFVHGWPGSFLEARKITPLLTEASEDYPSFHVIAVSLPGYGFSEAPKKRGFGLPEYAEACHAVMTSLGYGQYVVQGGDWGMSVARVLASKYGPSSVKAWHTNFPLGAGRWAKTNEFRQKEMAYAMLQGTKPQTIAYALTDSPVGLLAWIADKITAWTDDIHGLMMRVSPLSPNMLGMPHYGRHSGSDLGVVYWFSRAGPAATFRTYYEAMQRKGLGSIYNLVPSPPTIPLGFVLPARDIEISQSMGNVVFEADHQKGGHFAAYEVPELLVGDLRRMFGKGGPAFEAMK
ncbi:Alpha/Beta hydrolase protein [Schizophyllum amplum]|uniref:Alpha/Beta hydrolase protein n=1 Tax=Schizophyllum amplum TaxID=97359 RepID=A0A550CGV5_9AGAR|nr:Alpha/Beta hydrolase protein [Auriculariopsis ampla]